MKMAKKHIHTYLLLFLILMTHNTFSQIVGANAFMQGTYVEIGVNTCGAYGTPNAPPAGYHPTEFGLGFVADSDMDGWTTGTPDYCGDYFVPGSPVEGWEIQVGANVWTNTDQSCGTSEIPGDVTDYTYLAGVYATTWTGSITTGTFDIDVTQVTELPENELYFLTKVNICNNGVSALTDVYYKRNVDPDQDQPWGGPGAFTTENVIVSQPPDDCEAVVTSEGQDFGCFLGMGAIDSMARVSYGNFFTTDGTAAQAWAGTGGYSNSGSMTNDIATQITFKIPEILPGECQDIVFAYILNLDDLDEALAATGSYEMIVDDITIDNGDTVDACTIDTIMMTIVGGDGFDWVWTPSTDLDVDTGVVVFATPDVTTEYTATGFAMCDTVTFVVTINVPTPPLADAGPDVNVCSGDTVSLDGSGGATYLWSPPVYLDDPTLEDPAVQAPVTDMFYQLVVYNVLGCTDTDQVQVFLFPDPIIDAGDDEIMMMGGFVQLGASGGISYVWTPDTWLNDPFSSNPISLAEDTIMYYVTGTDANGCTNIDSMIVYVLEQTLVASPTAFTPNGDGLNDTYKPILIGLGDITGFSIYSRWGELLYSTEDETQGWDGTFKALEQEIGNYVVVIHAVDGLGVEFTKSSMVLLMR